MLFSRLIELKCIFLHSDVIRFIIHAGTLLSTQLCVCEVRTLHVVSWSLLSIYLDDYHCFIFSCFGQIKLYCNAAECKALYLGELKVIHLLKLSENPNTAVALDRLGVTYSVYLVFKFILTIFFLCYGCSLIVNFWSFVNLCYHVKNVDV